ncbi:MAG TPA: acetyl-CoA carboxylase biotin carboxylase subunit [Chthonomonadales bacterium]|nr:acetyl-CoA carboxylase biotin carboxylase subunit [Chthonomonadales bacterium]
MKHILDRRKVSTIRRVLIANRGEIAVRIIRACHEMGLSAVAVYSDADWDSPHVALADVAYRLGPAPATESYLHVERILEAAQQTGADAIHPGYGFLAENPDFAQACEEAGILFVGPPAEVIRVLGDKSEAKRLMTTAGVPVVPGYFGADQSNARLQREVRQLDLPLLIKAVAGGGGRGMRLVRTPEEFPGALDEARREARAAFGDDRLLLEHYIERPHHIEFQIFGDWQGNIAHLFERECSIQRRHQKIIEESPSPILTPALRERMAEAAIRAGKAARYVNAGTVEFLLEERPDGDHPFYFLEVNTRLQVEHPVTEAITGLDMVALQLRVASGETLPFKQEEINASGHAIEARIYAEDPAKGFLPSIGTLACWMEPSGPGVRVDSGVQRGVQVSPFYDPLLAKLIVHADTRDAAQARLERALKEFHVLGVQTNIAYLLDVISHPAFRQGDTFTDFLSVHFPSWRPSSTVPTEVLLALAVEQWTHPAVRSTQTINTGVEGDPYSPWRRATGWRNT